MRFKHIDASNSAFDKFFDGAVQTDRQPQPFGRRLPMSFQTSYAHKIKVKNALVDWQSQEDWSHDMTFAFNRPVAVERAKKIFGQYCMEMDRLKFRRHDVTRLRSEERFKAIAFIEHPETNIHIHAAAKLTGWWPQELTQRDIDIFAMLWRDCTQGSGDLLCRELVNRRGWLQYSTKDFVRNGGVYILSSDFHPS